MLRIPGVTEILPLFYKIKICSLLIYRRIYEIINNIKNNDIYVNIHIANSEIDSETPSILTLMLKMRAS